MHHRNQSCSFPEKFNKKKNANSVVTRAGQSNSLYMTFLVSAGFCNQHPFKKFIITWAVTLIAREGALTINFIMDQLNNLIKKHMWVSPSKTRLPVCLWQRLHEVPHLAWECLICTELHQMSEEKCTQLSSQFHDAHFDSSIIVSSTYKGLQQEQWEVLCLMSRQKLSYTEHLRKDYFFIGHNQANMTSSTL